MNDRVALVTGAGAYSIMSRLDKQHLKECAMRQAEAEAQHDAMPVEGKPKVTLVPITPRILPVISTPR